MADRSDAETPESEDNGVLEEPSADTSGIFLDGATAQVTVALPVPADDDDDAIDEDFEGIGAAASLTAENLDTAEAEIIDDVPDEQEAASVRSDEHEVVIDDEEETDEPGAFVDHVAVPVARPVRAVEQSSPVFDVELASKRLGELEVSREGADVLTAERLLDPHHAVKTEPEGFWQSALYRASGTLINVGDSKKAGPAKS